MGIAKLFLEQQVEWIRKHRYYMGVEEQKEILGAEALDDYKFGNDRETIHEAPSETFHFHLSPRNLTWEQEFHIYFWHNFIKQKNESGENLIEKDKKYIECRKKQLENWGIINLEPLGLVEC